MDWDDVRAPEAKTVTLGQDLAASSIAELEACIEALEAEIGRIKVAVEAKRKQAAAADAIFRM